MFAPLNTTWFALIGLLWTGYFFLEGFDFGVSIVAPFISRDETDKRICLNAIGPVWDGNEVWLIVAGGATFAAFPLWYARLFSGFYLALFLILIALIARGVSFEFRGKDDRPQWKTAWDAANFLGSLIPAIVWGVAFTDIVHGVPLATGGRYFGGLLGLLHPIAIVGGLVSLAVFVAHGSLFLSLKTTGELAERARRVAFRASGAAVVLLTILTAWIGTSNRPAVNGALAGTIPLVLALVALVGLLAATILAVRNRPGLAFAATGAAIVVIMGAVFARMFPLVLPASNVAANSLTIGASASKHNTLVVMTIVAAIFTPVVLAYQGWTYWVFRQRITRPANSLVDNTSPTLD
jgi:cytochrome d ubiquinol oxidase subunit II